MNACMQLTCIRVSLMSFSSGMCYHTSKTGCPNSHKSKQKFFQISLEMASDVSILFFEIPEITF